MAVFSFVKASDNTNGLYLSPSSSFLDLFEDVSEYNIWPFADDYFDFAYTAPPNFSYSFEASERGDSGEIYKSALKSNSNGNSANHKRSREIMENSASQATNVEQASLVTSSSSSKFTFDLTENLSELNDRDSSSSFHLKKSIKKLKRASKLKTSKSLTSISDKSSDISEHQSPKSSPSERFHFSKRSPFLYQTKCDCNKVHYNYISPALKHMTSVHNYEGKTFSDVIELIDDFHVIQDYPHVCEVCPFRTNHTTYLKNHQFDVHNIPRKGSFI